MHDVRACVRAIVTTAQLTQRRPDVAAADVQKALGQIVLSAKEIDALLTATTLYAAPMAARVSSLSSVIAGALLQVKPMQAATQSVVRVAEVPPNVAVDASLGWVVAELVSNAMKFNPERPSEISLEVAVDGARVRVEVRDRGPGIEGRHAQTIMLPYRKLQGRGAYEGTGMGLAIATRLAQRAGGSLHLAESEQGARLVVEWPVDEG